MCEEETKEEENLIKENVRWKDYASAMLIAMPVLLAGLTISENTTWVSSVSAVACFAGIVLITLWYGRDKNSNKGTPGNKYPTFLFYASTCFGMQIATLAMSFLKL